MIKGEDPLLEGQGPIWSGVTAIVPHDGSLIRDAMVGRAIDLRPRSTARSKPIIMRFRWIGWSTECASTTF